VQYWITKTLRNGKKNERWLIKDTAHIDSGSLVQDFKTVYMCLGILRDYDTQT